MSSPSSENYSQAQQLLQSAGLGLSPAEVQGMVCGILSGDAEPLREQWSAELLAAAEGQAAIPMVKQLLEQLWAQAVEQIDQDDLGLQLTLPADDAPVADRGLALRDWCQGFLYGFGLSGRTSIADLSAEVQEALQDFSEIARLDATEVSGDERDEQALMELEEYIRMGALLIRTEIVIQGRDPGRGANHEH